MKKKPPTDDGGTSNEAESPALKKLKSKVPDNRNKTIKEAVTKSVRPTLLKKVASTPRQHESGDVSDETPVLEKSSEKISVPAKSSEKTPVPAKSSEKTPAPAKSSEKIPVPAKSSEKTLAPAKSSEKTPVLAKSSEKTPLHVKSSEKTTVLVKSSDKTSEDVTQGPGIIKRKLSRSDDITAKRKRVSVINFFFSI